MIKNNPNTIFDIGSISKQFTAGLDLKLKQVNCFSRLLTNHLSKYCNIGNAKEIEDK
jgi:hypothetical protein